jgi:catechol 2,3-dioxygenase-like lactoylglutathione lyase family enzyme
MTAGAAPIMPAPCGGISHLTIQVTDPNRAIDFYGSVLGAGTTLVPDWPDDGEIALALRSGQVLAFRTADEPGPGEDSGVHQAYRCRDRRPASRRRHRHACLS